jgi:5'-methylthioadenosine phosphorylase
MQKVMVIAGSGFGKKIGGEEKNCKTRFGSVPYLQTEIAGKTVFVISRHGDNHSLPPRMIKHRANISAAKELDAEAIISTCAVGMIPPYNPKNVRIFLMRMLALAEKLDLTHPIQSAIDTALRVKRTNYKPGDLILCEGLVAFHAPISMIDSFPATGPIHPDMLVPFDSRLNSQILSAGASLGLRLKEGATLGFFEGARYETPQEVIAFGILGVDLLGMTVGKEVQLAAEINTPYSTIAIATNLAAGLSGKKLSHNEVEEMMTSRADDIYHTIVRTLETL